MVFTTTKRQTLISSNRAALWMVLLLLLPPLLPSAPHQGSGEEIREHPPILIDGDEDICRSGNIDGGIDKKTGIRNCNTADGSPQNPYEISGWDIRVEPSPLADEQPRHCQGADHVAAISICRVRHTLILRDLNIEFPHAKQDEDDLQGTAIYLHATQQVTLDELQITTGGIGVHVRGDPGAGFPTNVVMQRTQLQPFLDNTPPGALASVFNVDDPQSGNLSTFPMIETVDARMVVEASHINAALRIHGIRVDGPEHEDAATRAHFHMERSRLEHAVMTGIQASHAELQLTRNQLHNNSIISGSMAVPLFVDEPDLTTMIGGANLVLGPRTSFNITNNHFHVPGATTVGVSIETTLKGLIRENRFTQDPNQTFAVAVSNWGALCTGNVHYNDLNDHRVRNNEPSCRLDARHNWWGGQDGPSNRASGELNAHPWLLRPLDELPTVSIDRPAPFTSVHGGFTLSGSATGHPDNPLTHLQVSVQEDEWGDPVNISSTEAWQFEWGLTGMPHGLITFQVRGCGAYECGAPLGLPVRHVPIPPNPIAVITANPHVVHAGEPVLIDANRSYSPDGLPIVAYRFAATGDTPAAWQDTPVLETIYDTPGTRTITLTVQDDAGRESRNAPQLTLRVIAPLNNDLFAHLPAPGLALLFVPLLIGITALALHRRNRRPCP